MTSGKQHYAIGNILYHLVTANQVDIARDIFLSYKYLYGKLRTKEGLQLLNDVSLFPLDSELDFFNQILQLCIPTMIKNPLELPGQLIPRLEQAGEKAFERLREELESKPTFDWIKPFSGFLLGLGGILERVYPGHPSEVISLTRIGLDSFASAGQDGTIKIWGIGQSQEVSTLKSRHGSAWGLGHLSNNSLVSGHHDGHIAIWSADGFLLEEHKLHDAPIWQLAILHDNQFLVTVSEDHSACVWDIENRRVHTVFREHQERIVDVEIAKNGTVYTADDAHAIYAWDIYSGEVVSSFEGHESGLLSLALTPDESLLLSADETGNLIVWNTKTTKYISHNNFQFQILSMAVINDKVFLACVDNVVRIWDFLKQEEIEKLEGHSQEVNSIIFFESNYLVSASSDNKINLWDLSTREASQRPQRHKGRAMSVAISPDNQHGVSGGMDNQIFIWNLEKMKKIKTLSGHKDFIRQVAFCQRGTRIISVSADQTAIVWDVDNGNMISQFPNKLGFLPMFQLAPDLDQIILTNHQNNTVLWNISSQTEVEILYQHDDTISVLALSDSGKFLCSGDDTGVIKVWDLKNKCQISTFNGHDQPVADIKIIEDKNLLVSCGYDNKTIVWNLELSNAIRYTFEGHSDFVTQACILEDGAKIATASYDNTIRIWDMLSGEECFILQEHNAIISGMKVLPDGKLVSAGEDGQVIVWDTNVGKKLFGISLDTGIVDFAISLNGNTLFIGDRFGYIGALKIISSAVT